MNQGKNILNFFELINNQKKNRNSNNTKRLCSRKGG